MELYLGNQLMGEYLGGIDTQIQYKWPVFIDYLIVGGGGAAGQEDNASLTGGGGGGAGQFISGSTSFYVNYNQTFAVTVGTGGTDPGTSFTQGLPGNPSSFLGLTAAGGGGGGSKSQLAGGSGASGGGATFFGTSTASGGTATAGFNGAASYYTSQPSPSGTYRSGCGGGAGGAATTGTLVSQSVAGPPKAWLDGNLYAGGGASDDGIGGYNALSGSGGQGNTSALAVNGNNGIVIIRYKEGTAPFSGGDTFISGGYQYHTFLTSGTLTAL
jgi:hypothetical protein